MPLSKMSDLRQLTDAEISEQIEAAKRDLFNLRLQQVTRSTDARPKPHQYKHIKHRLAQLMTLEGERARMARASRTEAETAAGTATEATNLTDHTSASEEK
ncbi:50S ribosomal protein L29 [Trichothermofontia sp.]